MQLSNVLKSALTKRRNINQSGKTIYDHVDIGDPEYWFTSEELEFILNYELTGSAALVSLPLRTRSKVMKELICDALGYPRPASFKMTQPRFQGQLFDTYGQKTRNLQIWNEEVHPERRYVIVGIDDFDIIKRIKIVAGVDLEKFDNTGTMTSKHQARLNISDEVCELVSASDTENLQSILSTGDINLAGCSPVDQPSAISLMPIHSVYEKLSQVIGASFPDPGHDQERNRGAALHRIVCKVLGYSSYKDDGRFPDVKHQLLEVKLQTSPTIDLGLVCPNESVRLDIENIDDHQIRRCDVRYAIFYANIANGMVNITNFYLSTGKDFFQRFPRFEGKVINGKIQLTLPANFLGN